MTDTDNTSSSSSSSTSRATYVDRLLPVVDLLLMYCEPSYRARIDHYVRFYVQQDSTEEFQGLLYWFKEAVESSKDGWNGLREILQPCSGLTGQKGKKALNKALFSMAGPVREALTIVEDIDYDDFTYVLGCLPKDKQAMQHPLVDIDFFIAIHRLLLLVTDEREVVVVSEWLRSQEHQHASVLREVITALHNGIPFEQLAKMQELLWEFEPEVDSAQYEFTSAILIWLPKQKDMLELLSRLAAVSEYCHQVCNEFSQGLEPGSYKVAKKIVVSNVISARSILLDIVVYNDSFNRWLPYQARLSSTDLDFIDEFLDDFYEWMDNDNVDSKWLFSDEDAEAYEQQVVQRYQQDDAFNHLFATLRGVNALLKLSGLYQDFYNWHVQSQDIQAQAQDKPLNCQSSFVKMFKRCPGLKQKNLQSSNTVTSQSLNDTTVVIVASEPGADEKGDHVISDAVEVELVRTLSGSSTEDASSSNEQLVRVNSSSSPLDEHKNKPDEGTTENEQKIYQPKARYPSMFGC